MENNYIDVARQILKEAGIQIVSETTTSDHSVILRISPDLFLDVYPEGDIVVMHREGATKFYDEYEFEDIMEVLKKYFFTTPKRV